MRSTPDINFLIFASLFDYSTSKIDIHNRHVQYILYVECITKANMFMFYAQAWEILFCFVYAPSINECYVVQ